MRKSFILATLAVSVVGATTAVAAPGPVPAVGSTKWQLDFEFHDPQRISVQLPGDAEAKTFWYLLYTVTNNTGADVQYYPSVDLVTDSLQTVEAGAGIPPRVFDQIKARHVQQ